MIARHRFGLGFAITATVTLSGCAVGKLTNPQILLSEQGVPTYRVTVDDGGAVLDCVSLTVERSSGGTTEVVRPVGNGTCTQSAAQFDVLGAVYAFGPDTQPGNDAGRWVVTRWEADFRGAFNMGNNTKTANRTLVDLTVDQVRLLRNGQPVDPVAPGQPGAGSYQLNQGEAYSVEAVVRNVSATNLPHGIQVKVTWVGANSPLPPVTETAGGPVPANGTVTVVTDPVTVNTAQFFSATLVVEVESDNFNGSNDFVNTETVWVP